MRLPAGRGAAAAAVSTSLVLTLALQSAVPPFATDMYTPAFPQVTADLAATASLVGLTLTTSSSAWRRGSCSVDRGRTSVAGGCR